MSRAPGSLESAYPTPPHTNRPTSADADELSEAAGESMAITRDRGGWVAGSEIDTQGNHTREFPAAKDDEGGAAGAADDALRFLADAGAIALFLVIVLSPVVLVGADLARPALADAPDRDADPRPPGAGSAARAPGSLRPRKPVAARLSGVP